MVRNYSLKNLKKQSENWVECDSCHSWTCTRCQPKDIDYDEDFFFSVCRTDTNTCL